MTAVDSTANGSRPRPSKKVSSKRAEGLSDNDIYNLIFEPGFSTAAAVTNVSGRGVGMDVVRKHIEKLRGRIEIRSTPGQGASFFLKLATYARNHRGSGGRRGR